MSKKIDVIINVCGKVYQTALALLTLEKHCGQHIDKIWFVEENTDYYNLSSPGGHHEFVRDKLAHKIVYRMPERWNYCFELEYDKLDDRDYRQSIRYQWGWESTDKDQVLVIHNDVWFHGDAVGAMLAALGEHVAIGHVGQCWYCPAAFTGKCSSERFMDYRPDFLELRELYRRTKAPEGSYIRAYHIPRMHAMFERQPWPLPECRVNEWCALINMAKARKLTAPLGRGTPFGAILNVGKQILDVGCQWFRDMHLYGRTCGHFDIYQYMHHDVPPTGQPTLLDKDRYKDNELAALERLQQEFDHPEVQGT